MNACQKNTSKKLQLPHKYVKKPKECSKVSTNKNDEKDIETAKVMVRRWNDICSD